MKLHRQHEGYKDSPSCAAHVINTSRRDWRVTQDLSKVNCKSCLRQYKPARFTEDGRFVGGLPHQCVKECSSRGDVTESVKYWVHALNFTVPRVQAKLWLWECGSWTREELDDMSDEDLAEKVLWIACCDIRDGLGFHGLSH